MKPLSEWGLVFLALMLLAGGGVAIDLACWLRFGTILGTSGFVLMALFLGWMGAFDGWRDRMWSR